jgi:hypothetical protein
MGDLKLGKHALTPLAFGGNKNQRLAFLLIHWGLRGVSTDAGARYELTSIQFCRIPHSAMTTFTFVKLQSFI